MSRARRQVHAHLATLCLAASGICRAQEAQHPNIVLILADDLGYGDVSCLNPESKIPTPAIDRLAADGISFTDAHAPSSVCSPTRYALMTGRYAWRGSLVKGVLRGAALPAVEDGRLTLPEMLRRAGYHTAIVGKWHLGFEYALRRPQASQRLATIDFGKPLITGPRQFGFDYYFGLAKPAWTFTENDVALALPTERFNVTNLGLGRMGDGNLVGVRAPGFRYEHILPEFTERAVAFLEKGRETDKPFFLYFAPLTPHQPLVPNEEFVGKSEAGVYGDFVAELDWSVGQILEALERTGCADDTLVIFTSDNGPERIAYDRIRTHEHFSMGPWRGVKRDTWEGGHRVPFVARWPGEIPAGTTSAELISLVDMLATCAALAEVELPAQAGEDSYDISPALRGTNREPIREATVYQSNRGKLAIRRGPWVLIRAQSGGENREPPWYQELRQLESHRGRRVLFHLDRDPGQQTNRLAEFPEIAAELEKLLETYEREGRSARRS